MRFKNYPRKAGSQSRDKLANKWPYLATIFGFFLLIPIGASADIVGELIKPFWAFFVTPLIWVLQLEMVLLKVIASYNNFTNEGGVELGWITLRDLSNMFFILILLVISFATILRISSYGYQQLLKRTILVAIFINFSKTIVGFVIDIVQVVMLTFIAAIDEVMTGGIIVAVGLHELFTFSNKGSSDLGGGDNVLALIMATVFLAILVIIIGVMVMMLMMRIVALWVAIVLAPLAFVASIFPATKSFYSKWLKELGSNLVSGPMLAFFLWLTFSIVGNGEAYNSFLGEDDGGLIDAPTKFLETSNMVNYVIAISLLLMGLKMAAASGAAGASFASKGMAKIQSTASKVARRYPGALSMRLASGVAGGLVDKDGKMRGGRFGKVISRVPFYGGRLQRGAMAIQGKRKAMEDQFNAEDTKGVLPQHRAAFFGSKKTLRHDNKHLDRLGRGYSRISSLGGSKAQDAAYWETQLKEGKIESHGDAMRAKKSAKDTNNQELTDAIHKARPDTYETEKEINRDIQRIGIPDMMRGLKAEAAVDKDGNITAGAKHLLEVVRENKNTKAGDIGEYINRLDPRAKSAWGKVLVANQEDRKNKEPEKLKSGEKPPTVIKTNKKGEAEFTEHGTFALNQDDIDTKLTADMIRVYPNLAAKATKERSGAMAREISSGDVKLPDNAIKGLRLTKSEKDKAKKKKWEESVKKNKDIQDDPGATDKEKKDAQDTHDKKKREIYGASTPKELREQVKATKKRKDAGEIEDDEAQEEYREAYDNPMMEFGHAELADIEPKILEQFTDKFSEDIKTILGGKDVTGSSTAKELAAVKIELGKPENQDDLSKLVQLEKQQNFLMRKQGISARQALGMDTPEDKDDHYTKAILREASDGANYSRLSEMDISDPIQEHLFKELAKVATPNQQKQLLDTGNPEQLELLAEAIVSIGQRPAKNILDQFSASYKREIIKKMELNISMKKGLDKEEAEVEYDEEQKKI